MKTTLFAAAIAVIGTPMFAEGTSGLSFGGEAVTEYNMDAEKMTVVLTPEVTYVMGDLDFTVSSDLSMYDSSAADRWAATNLLEKGFRPTIDAEVNYALRPNVDVYAKSGWNLDTQKRSDLTVGMAFEF